MFTRIKTAKEIDDMRVGGKMLATVLQKVREAAKPGASELDIDVLAERELKALGGKPSFKGYHGFPGVICISVNNEVVHGIPGERQLQDGDVVGFDFGVTYNGLVTDSALSMVIGSTPNTAMYQLVSATEQALNAGIGAVKDGATTGDIGAAVESVLNIHKYGIVREFVGHGVGHHLHEEPDVPNYGRAGSGSKLAAGMTIAIEPMATVGSERVMMDPDGWTVVTADGKPSAHFEHTVLVTDSGAEILTKL